MKPMYKYLIFRLTEAIIFIPIIIIYARGLQ